MNMADSINLRAFPAPRCFDRPTGTASESVQRHPGAPCPHFSVAHPPSFEFDGYRIGVAHTQGQLNEVRSLLHRMYSWRGYTTSVGEETRGITDRITLKASTGDHVMGTLSVALDSPAGLAADELYRDEVDGYRTPGRRLCEFTRLAIDIEPRFNSKDFLARLIHVAFVYARLIHHATDMLIEINPRHVGFYRRSLGFRQVGPERMCSRVGAPAVLMHIDLHHMATQIRVHGGGKCQGGERTLYPHFLSGAEQRMLLERMRHYLHCQRCMATPLLPRFVACPHGQRPEVPAPQQALAA